MMPYRMNNALMPALNYISEGEGLPVIMVHGMAASLFDWQHLLPELTARGYRGIAVDLPGHGESPKPDDPKAYQSSAIFDAFETWVAILRLGCPALFIGHSMGGFLALNYAQQHPTTTLGLVLIDPFYTTQQLSPIMRFFNNRPQMGLKALKAVPQWLIQTVMRLDPATTTHFTPHIRQQIAQDYKRATPYIMNISATAQDLSGHLWEIDAPTRIIWGMNDATLNPRSFPRLVDRMPHAVGYPVPGSGHQPHLSQPEIVNSIVFEFLESLTGEKQVLWTHDRPADL